VQWPFSCRDVVTGAIRYGLEDFRIDLMRQVEAALPGFGARQIHGFFNLNYLLLYWLASGGSFDDFVAALHQQLRPASPWLAAHLDDLQRGSTAEVAMLSAILRRMTLDGIEAGLPLELALDRARADQERIAAAPQPLSRPQPPSAP
jgi:hypothetical protein